MIFLEILIVVMVGFLVYKFILMPNFSTKKVDIAQTPKEFGELYNKFNELDFLDITISKKKLMIFSIIGIISFMAFLFTFIFTYLNSFNMAFAIIPLIALAVTVILFLLEFKKFKVKYSNVIKRFLQLIDPSLTYNNTSYVDEENYYQTACFDNLQLSSLITKDTISGAAVCLNLWVEYFFVSKPARLNSLSTTY